MRHLGTDAELHVESDLLQKYATAAPRYTSYPTAPHFNSETGAKEYGDWLAALPDGTSLSLYLHIPYCESLCWFCGCHTKATRRYAPVGAYLRHLHEEIALVGAAIPKGCSVKSIHWGGGTPTMLTSEDISALSTALRSAFDVAPDAEFAAEIDPRGLTQDRIAALAEAGLTRASIGVQDFNPTVQEAINREQSPALTKAVIDALRNAGVPAVNVDILYGLPHQTAKVLIGTLIKVLQLKPDRIALFGYAHVPWLKRHQGLIDEKALPDAAERFHASQLAADLISSWGYERIGIDHFALPDDPLAGAARRGRLHRNFQGYTTDECEALIGLGASAIGRLPQGYVQNAVPVDEYAQKVSAGAFAVSRGVAFGGEDRVRGYAIERLMCDFRVSGAEVRRKFGPDGEGLLADAERLAADDADGLVFFEDGTIRVTERGRPFVRAICAALDPYFAAGNARHSIAV
jgi:oxygen-independent coproporphyrinogen-3 oxidase